MTGFGISQVWAVILHDWFRHFPRLGVKLFSLVLIDIFSGFKHVTCGMQHEGHIIIR